MHVGMITINGEKMSKSKGNTKTIRHVLENFGANITRLFCLSAHYSKPIDYSEDLLQENITKWRQVESCYYEMNLAQGDGSTDEIKKIISECQNEFDNALEDDFNTHLALSAFFKFVNEINQLAASETITKSISDFVIPAFEKMIGVLGLKIPKITKEEIGSINEMIKKRESLRVEKKFQEADSIRDQISEMGIELLDHKNGTTWIKKEKIQSEHL